MGNQTITTNVVAGADLSADSNKLKWVYLDSADNYEAKLVTDPALQTPFGVLQGNPLGDGEYAEVAVAGGPARVLMGDVVNPGDRVSVSASALTVSAGALQKIVGIYLGNGNGQPVASASGGQGLILLLADKTRAA